MDSAVAGIVGTIAGITLKWCLDFISQKRNEKIKFSVSVKKDQLNRLVEDSARLIEECKIQVQSLQYGLHESYWIITGVSQGKFDKSQREVEERGQRIIHYKETCTAACAFVKNGEEIKGHLDDIVKITDYELPKYLDSHVVLGPGVGTKWLTNLNNTRELIIRDLVSGL
ncbi:hypothetical protein [Lactiplantibacillus pentosus]|uniref:hypothetical protein n=1 Tax=Lactiplantibacillus pentosus TaxID=1589 RepID=UPI003D792EB5